MKTKIFTVLSILTLSTLAWADGKVIKVKGMVCAFCAQGIEKSFASMEEVKKVKVDLQDKRVDLTFKPGKTLEDKEIERKILDAGYNVESIKNVPEEK